ncbi:MAG: hypothetical protein SPL96_11150 [Bacteroidales bacterium]|nr:hypothetical protein [Bacteroidales bacterium]
MAIENVINDSWENHTHGEVEAALKGILQTLQGALDGLSGKIGKERLSEELSSLLSWVSTLKDNLKTVATSGSYNDLSNKPALYDEVVFGRIDESNNNFYRLKSIVGNNNVYEETPIDAPNIKFLYVNIQKGKLYRWNTTRNPAFWDELCKFPIDTGLVENSRNAVENRAVFKAFKQRDEKIAQVEEEVKQKQDKIQDITEFIRQSVVEIVGENGDQDPMLDQGGHVPYSMLPRMVLDGMNHNHNDININPGNAGKTYYCTDNNIRYYYDGGRKWVTSSPDAGVIYCDRATKTLYLWIDNAMTPITINSEDHVEVVDRLDSDDPEAALSANQGRIIAEMLAELPHVDDSGKLSYSLMPSCFLDSINYVKGLKPTSELLGKVLFTTSGKILTVAATLVNNTSAYTWVEQDPSAGVLYWFNNRPYRWNPSEGLLEPYHICNIAIVGADEAVPDWADLCFFSYPGSDYGAPGEESGGGTAPDEPVTPPEPEPEVITISGDDFNALLAGNDPQTVYNPSQLYELDGVVDADNLDNNAPGYSYVSQGEREDEGEAVVRGNRVSYKYTDASDVEHTVLTPLNYHGDLVLSNTVKMADTADTAYLSFMVSGPFIAPSTNVKVDFTDTDVEVYYWMKKNGKALQQIPSGHVFRFSNTEAAREVMLVIKRKSLGMGIGYTTTALKTYVDITRIQGGIFHPTRVAVIFNPTRLFCRNGAAVRGSGFTIEGANAIELPEPYADMSRASLSQGAGYLLFEKSGMLCPLITGVNFDMTKYNVFYAVLANRDTSWQEAIVYNDAWGGAWVYDEQGNRTPRNQGDASIENSYCRSGAKPFHEIDSWINRVGNYILRCSVHNERAPEEALKTLDLYLTKVNSEMKVLEFGIITYDTSLL